MLLLVQGHEVQLELGVHALLQRASGTAVLLCAESCVEFPTGL